MKDIEYYPKEKQLNHKIYELEAMIDQKYQFVEQLSQNSGAESKRLSIKYIHEIKKLEEELSNTSLELDALKNEFYSDEKFSEKSQTELPDEINEQVTKTSTGIDRFLESEKQLIHFKSRFNMIQKELNRLKKQNSTDEEILYFLDMLQSTLEGLMIDIEVHEKLTEELNQRTTKDIADVFDALHDLDRGAWKPKQME